jgi:hypothetical protein
MVCSIILTLLDEIIFMEKLLRDFVSNEQRTYNFRLGQVVASALTGFLAGLISASIIWMLALYYVNNFILNL